MYSHIITRVSTRRIDGGRPPVAVEPMRVEHRRGQRVAAEAQLQYARIGGVTGARSQMKFPIE